MQIGKGLDAAAAGHHDVEEQHVGLQPTASPEGLPGVRAPPADAQARPAGDVASLDGYEGVVLGSSIYMGRLHADARRFLRRHRSGLAVRRIGVFAMGPRTLSDEDVTRSHNQLGAALANQSTLHPCTTVVFGGVFDPAQHHFPFNRMPASDARDWAAVRAWADDFATRF